jgi:hypothetical protein
MGDYRIRLLGMAETRPGVGRHRLGAPGLKYCRHHRPVRARLVRQQVSRRRAAPASRVLQVTTLLAALTVTGTVLVSGWYAAAGAAAIAGMVGH